MSSFESLFKDARTDLVVWAHHDGRAIVKGKNGDGVRLSPLALKALCNAGILVKDTVPLDKNVDIYVPVKNHPLAEALLGDDPFAGV